MRTWQVQDAKARFSELLDACLNEGPQRVSRRGEPTAVLVSLRQWEQLERSARPSLKALLLSGDARAPLTIPPRGRAGRRKAVALG